MEDGVLLKQVLDVIFFLIPILLPIGLIWFLVDAFLTLSRQKFRAGLEFVLLEVVPPQDIEKSPAAMELFLVALFNTGDPTNWYEKYIKGKIRAWFSLEIISKDGFVHFYIWTQKKFRKNIEAQLYAQFPGIEVLEADDYAAGLECDGSIELFGAEMKLKQPDPYPIKTYVDYGLDQETEEGIKVDPITTVLEMLGTLEPGHQVWIQLVIRSHGKEDKDPNKWLGKTDAWKDSAKDEIKKIRKDALIEVKEGDVTKQVPQMTKGQDLRIAALERSVSKLSFDVGLRLIYLSETDVFAPDYIGAMLGSFKQFNSPDLNSFGIGIATSFDQPWEDPTGKKNAVMKSEMLEAYKERAYFWKPYRKFFWWRPSRMEDRKHFILNTEELATLFHFPGRVAQTPTVERVQSKKATAPANLPI